MSRPTSTSPPTTFPQLGRPEWQERLRTTLGDRSLDSLVQPTFDGPLLPPIGFPEDATAAGGQAPGFAPFRRGACAAGVLGGWDLRAIHSQPAPETANREILEDLGGGVTSIELVIADPGGGEPGLRLDAEDGGGALDALDRALADVDLEIAPVALAAGDGFREAAAALIALWRRRGIEGERCRGAFNADPIGVAARRGYLDATAFQRLAELASTIASTHPLVTCARADSTVHHDAGATEAQELACLLSTGVAYLRALVDAGIPVETALRQVALRCALAPDFLIGLAKVRALRELWSRVAEASLEASGDSQREGASAPIVEAIAGRRALSRVDPWTNLLRVGSGMIGAALGGAQTLVSLPDPDALGIPSRDLARRLARNLQLVLTEEAHVDRVIDPAGGAWALESLTDRLAEGAWERFQSIEGRGGILAGLREGWLQREIGASADRRAQAARSRRQILVGVNDYCDPEDAVVDPGESAGAGDAEHREASAVVVEPLFAPVLPSRTAEPFERLRRDAAARLPADARGVFLAKLGAPAACTPRARFAASVLAVAGLAVIELDACSSVQELAASLRRSGRTVAVLCSSDALHAEHGVEAVKALREAGAAHVVIAGRPGELEASLRAAGADQFLHAGADLLSELEVLVEALVVAGEAATAPGGGGPEPTP